MNHSKHVAIHINSPSPYRHVKFYRIYERKLFAIWLCFCGWVVTGCIPPWQSILIINIGKQMWCVISPQVHGEIWNCDDNERVPKDPLMNPYRFRRTASSRIVELITNILNKIVSTNLEFILLKPVYLVWVAGQFEVHYLKPTFTLDIISTYTSRQDFNLNSWLLLWINDNRHLITFANSLK